MKDLPDAVKKTADAVAKAGIKEAAKEAAIELAEINTELADDVSKAFNAEIAIIEFFDLESDKSE